MAIVPKSRTCEVCIPGTCYVSRQGFIVYRMAHIVDTRNSTISYGRHHDIRRTKCGAPPSEVYLALIVILVAHIDDMCSSTTGRNRTSIEIHTWYVPKQRAHVSKFHRNAVPITGSSVEAPLFRYIYRHVLKYQGHVYQVYNICTNNAMPMHEKAVNGDGLCAGCTPCGQRRRVDPWPCPSERYISYYTCRDTS